MNDTEAPTYQPVIINSESLPAKPKIGWWDWIKYYAYNTYRKPLVYKKQKEMVLLAQKVKEKLDTELLSNIYKYRSQCDHCRNNYIALKPQIFLSQIEMILTKMPCPKHQNLYKDFYKKYRIDFVHSESLAKWINGFN